jgi:hypothetical protein
MLTQKFTLLLTAVVLLCTSPIAFAQGGDQLKAKLAELDKLRAEKIITDQEYAEARKAAIQQFTTGATTAPAPAGAAAPAPAGPLDLSNPVTAAKAFIGAIERNDIESLKKILSVEAKARMTKDGVSWEKYVARYAKTKIISVDDAEPPTEREGRTITRVEFTMEERGKRDKAKLPFALEGKEWKMDKGH